MGGGCTSPAPPRQGTLPPPPQEPEIQSLLQFCTGAGILCIIGSVLQAARFESFEYMLCYLLTRSYSSYLLFTTLIKDKMMLDALR